MTDLRTLVDPLKRELAVPGTYDDVFPDTDDTALLGSLLDGFSEAQLQGFFQDITLTGSVTSKDLSLAGGALVVMFSAMRIIRAQLRSMTMTSTYKAGPVEVSTQRSGTLLRDELAYLRTRIDELVATARRSGRTVHVLDNYVSRVLRGSYQGSHLGAFFGYEYDGYLGGCAYGMVP